MYNNLQLDIIREFGSKNIMPGAIIQYSDGVIQTYPSPYVPVCGNRDFQILGHIPHLEDLFRVAEEKDWLIHVSHEKYICIRKWRIKNSNDNIPYNPSIPLLDQSESTLTQLLTLFKKG